MIDDNRNSIFSIVPGESYSERIASGADGAQKGLRYQVRIDRFAKYLNVSQENIVKVLPPDKEEFMPFKGGEKRIIGFFKSEGEIETFLKAVSKLNPEKTTQA